MQLIQMQSQNIFETPKLGICPPHFFSLSLKKMCIKHLSINKLENTVDIPRKFNLS